MQDHLKERLTGAAILVVVVVLLVPEMFRGRPGGGAARSTAAPAGAPVRTYNIDLRDSPATLPPVVAVASPGAAPAAGATAAVNAPQPASTVQPASAVHPASAAESAEAPRAAAPAPGARPPAAVVERKPGPAAAGWTVQVGSFTRRDFAERMVRQLRIRGFAVEAVGPDDRGLYRVRSAPLPERAAALALKQKMQARGLKPIVNAAP
ncbi:MAG: SPOR domain-containing protein [Gammaproteobacteria bacterium]|nr:SPOR domain-containing protein [Gammaproteobacteria bacterium]